MSQSHSAPNATFPCYHRHPLTSTGSWLCCWCFCPVLWNCSLQHQGHAVVEPLTFGRESVSLLVFLIFLVYFHACFSMKFRLSFVSQQASENINFTQVKSWMCTFAMFHPSIWNLGMSIHLLKFHFVLLWWLWRSCLILVNIVMRRFVW